MICSCHSGEYEEHWHMTPCSLTETDQNLGATCCWQLHGRRTSKWKWS